jgi:hypothetical protein
MVICNLKKSLLRFEVNLSFVLRLFTAKHCQPHSKSVQQENCVGAAVQGVADTGKQRIQLL